MSKHLAAAAPEPIRCAIYTRKSTSEGLDQEFNTLDAQREAAEAFIQSQRHEGWVALPTRYDDGGFSGAHTDRPALQRLLEDIDSGLVDTVVVYKVDRLSRSLLDFARMIRLFDDKKVSFVSTTQHFNTATSLGRLVLNILLSFAQFEREMISERTRDKVAAARRKGKWTGGPPVLGYAIDRGKLQVLPDEAHQVRTMFSLYLELKSTGLVSQRLRDMGWVKKRHITRDDRQIGGGQWDPYSVHRHLTNPIYKGKVRYKDELHEGEHEAIVAEEVFERVQKTLASYPCGRGLRRSVNPEFLLSGIIDCGICGEAMTTNGGRNRRGKNYRYYVCKNRSRREHEVRCTHPRLPGPEIEGAVVAYVRGLCADAAFEEQLSDAAPTEAASILDDWEAGWAEAEDATRRALVQTAVARVEVNEPAGKLSIELREAAQ